MKLLTPAEYADAFRFWTEQEDRTLSDDVAEQMAPHVTLILAERERIEAIHRYRDTREAITARRRDLLRDMDQWQDPRTRKKAAA